MKHLFAILPCLLLTASACSLEAEDEVSSSVLESHSWGGYHWARTSGSFDLRTINSLTSDWQPYLDGAASDWNTSSKLNFAVEAGDTSTKTRRRCGSPEGTIRVCNLAYGQNGWLGIAGISLDSSGHISKGYTKLNDTYFAWDYYNNDLWKQSVTCQEIGHNVGLGHQDEDFNNESLFTCMDYQDPPFPSPNAHDYDQLVDIYGHTDSYDSYDDGSSSGGGDGGGSCNAPPGKGCNKGSTGWGVSVGRHGQREYFMRRNGDGGYELTSVTWAVGF